MFIDFTLKDFLATGKLGAVRRQVSRSEIQNLLGEPEAWAPITRKKQTFYHAGVWKYGDLQLGFTLENRVSYIGFYPARDLNLPAILRLKGYFPTAKTTIAEFTHYLEQNTLNYTQQILNGSLSLAISPNVKVYFFDSGEIAKMIVI